MLVPACSKWLPEGAGCELLDHSSDCMDFKSSKITLYIVLYIILFDKLKSL